MPPPTLGVQSTLIVIAWTRPLNTVRALSEGIASEASVVRMMQSPVRVKLALDSKGYRRSKPGRPGNTVPCRRGIQR